MPKFVFTVEYFIEKSLNLGFNVFFLIVFYLRLLVFKSKLFVRLSDIKTGLLYIGLLSKIFFYKSNLFYFYI